MMMMMTKKEQQQCLHRNTHMLTIVLVIEVTEVKHEHIIKTHCFLISYGMYPILLCVFFTCMLLTTFYLL